MNAFWQSLISAAVSGAAGAAGTVVTTGKISWTVLGVNALIGAAIGVGNFLKASPLTAKDKPVETPKA
jgi:hypothetical protein